MAQVITVAGERLFALKAQNNEKLDIDTFIFANVPGQDPNAPINRSEGVPPLGQQVHTKIVQQVGRVNDNVVIYSTVLDSLTGPFEFNWVGLYSSVNQTLVAISHIPTVQKTVTVPGAAGNTLNRNFGIEYSGIADLTGITVAPETWQLDYTARLNGMDELTRQLAADMNGKDWFIGDGFKVEPRSTLNTFKVTPGAGYVSGLRIQLDAEQILTLSSYPQFVYVDAWFDGTSGSQWKGQTAFTVTNTEMDDYIDVNGKQHYVTKVATITAADSVTDLRNLNFKTKIKFHNGLAALPAMSFMLDPDTGLYRKAEDSLSIATGGVERINIRADGRVGIGTDAEPIAAKLHVQFNQLAIGILSRGYFEGSAAQPYINNDVILCETYNRTVDNSANRSWAISCSNAYHDIPEGVTDSGNRVGVIGWAVSVNGRPGYEHRGTIEQLNGVQGTSGFQGAGYPTAVINEAAGVRGLIYADNDGATIKFARGGIFVSDGLGLDGTTATASTIEDNIGVYARAKNGTTGNWSFYGDGGTLYNLDKIFTPAQVVAGNEYTQSASKMCARHGGNSYEFGYPDGSGYGSNIGATNGVGYPFIALCAESDQTGDTFTTRGNPGTVIYNNLDGGTIYGRVVNASAAGQAVIEDMRHRSDGRFSFDKNLMLASAPPATSGSTGEPGEVTWDANYIYICIAVNTWHRAALTAW